MVFVSTDDEAQDAVDAAASAAALRASDEPVYRATPQEGIRRFFTKYAVFHGRASRSEFWWAYAMNLAVFFAVGIAVEMVNSVVGPEAARPTTASTVIGVVYLAYVLATLLPSIAVFVRRLHDANLAGWWVLLTLIPFAGVVIGVILSVLPRQGYGTRFDRA